MVSIVVTARLPVILSKLLVLYANIISYLLLLDLIIFHYLIDAYKIQYSLSISRTQLESSLNLIVPCTCFASRRRMGLCGTRRVAGQLVEKSCLKSQHSRPELSSLGRSVHPRRPRLGVVTNISFLLFPWRSNFEKFVTRRSTELSGTPLIWAPASLFLHSFTLTYRV